ncbi:MAG: hypothetical protein RLZZ528_1395, partial [Pseudomonadota bacterium]
MTANDPAGQPVFLHGVLLHPELRLAVIGRDADVRPASAEGLAVLADDSAPNARLVTSPGRAEGLVAEGLTAAEVQRLVWFHGAAPVATAVLTVAGGPSQALAFVAAGGPPTGQAAFDPERWAGRWAPTATLAARDFMRLAGSVPEGTLRRRYPQMLTRAGARLRAGQAGPSGLRRSAAPDDVSETRFRQPYADYFAVEEFDVRFRR